MSTDIKILIELIEAAVDTEMPETLLKVFSQDVLNEQSKALRKDANNIIAKELKVNPIADEETAKKAMDKLSQVDKQAFFKLIGNYLAV